jgi:hypothetical protein
MHGSLGEAALSELKVEALCEWKVLKGLGKGFEQTETTAGKTGLFKNNSLHDGRLSHYGNTPPIGP